MQNVDHWSTPSSHDQHDHKNPVGNLSVCLSVSLSVCLSVCIYVLYVCMHVCSYFLLCKTVIPLTLMHIRVSALSTSCGCDASLLLYTSLQQVQSLAHFQGRVYFHHGLGVASMWKLWLEEPKLPLLRTLPVLSSLFLSQKIHVVVVAVAFVVVTAAL